MIPNAEQIHTSLRRIMGPPGDAGGDGRRAARFAMSERVEALLPRFGIPPGGDRRGRSVDRRSVYSGPTTPTLYHKLEIAFHTTGPDESTRQDVGHYQAGLVVAEQVYPDMVFCSAVVLREHFAGLAAHGERMLPDTFSAGGLDHLGGEMRRMDFLPAGTRDDWVDLGRGQGCEGPGRTRCHEVHPASIPRGDELLAYAGTLRLKEQTLRDRVNRVLNQDAGGFMEMNDDQRRAWTQLAFARANGFEYVSGRGDRQLSSGDAGLITVLGALKHYGETGARSLDPEGFFDVAGLSNMTSVRIARARAVEARLLDDYGLLSLGSPGASLGAHP